MARKAAVEEGRTSEAQRLRVGDINPAIRDKIRGLKAGEPSPHMRAGNSVVVLMACSREEPPSGLPSRDDIEETIMRQRLDLLPFTDITWHGKHLCALRLELGSGGR